MRTTDIKDKARELKQRATEQARRAGEATDTYVRENTWTTLAAAALLGCIVGYMLANPRRRKEEED